MRYYKIIEDNEPVRIGIGADGVAITKAEYLELLDYFKSIPFEIPAEALEE